MLRSRSLTFFSLYLSNHDSTIKYLTRLVSWRAHILCVILFHRFIFFSTQMSYRVCGLDSLRPSDAIWHGSALAQVLACGLMAPKHYLIQCWIMIYIYIKYLASSSVAEDIYFVKCHTWNLPEPVLTYHQRCSVTFTWEQFHKKYSWTLTVYSETHL